MLVGLGFDGKITIGEHENGNCNRNGDGNEKEHAVILLTTQPEVPKAQQRLEIDDETGNKRSRDGERKLFRQRLNTS